MGGDGDSGLGAVNMGTPGAGAREGSNGDRRGQPRRQREHQEEEDEGEEPLRAREDGESCHSPNSMR